MTHANGIEEIKALAGADLGHGDWVEITQERIDRFADATDDHQWIHVDPERAAVGPFGGTIAHGYLTLSLLIPLFSSLLQITGVRMSVNYGLERVRFPSPVPAGGKIRLAGKVAEVVDIADGVQMVLDFTIELDGSAKPACVARAVYRHYA
ncbi:MaoC family dehydratase [Amycolatopsis sp. EV170708-02-1]|uniref:MaoC family dehydratase n=1 Tax=Amycolatopsis sp. EV170708-02-1 TaxID=2919322 RepID=UPI001F0C3114|nr:MaoC family dehydratase [Amycolatopsis sp. EV170708-02-1]UMO99954.1 MaoC family dehydratase [Amycolatopsis sp. EV170708-02-1]